MLVNIPRLTRCLDAGADLIAGDIVAYKKRTYRIVNLVCDQLGELSPPMIDLVSLAAFAQELGHWNESNPKSLSWMPENLPEGEQSQGKLLRDMINSRRKLRRLGEPVVDAYRTAHWINAWPVVAKRLPYVVAMTQTFGQFPTSRLDTILRRRFVSEIAKGLLGIEH
jgi:hypothetical protein